jgi:hypothetical protein
VSRDDTLLKVGVVMMALALVIAAVVVSVALRSVPEQAVASKRVATTKSSAEHLVCGESPHKPWVEKPRPLSTADRNLPR